MTVVPGSGVEIASGTLGPDVTVDVFVVVRRMPPETLSSSSDVSSVFCSVLSEVGASGFFSSAMVCPSFRIGTARFPVKGTRGL